MGRVEKNVLNENKYTLYRWNSNSVAIEEPGELEAHRTGLLPANYPYTSIKGFSNLAIDGGAATMLHVKLNPGKQLKSLTLKAIANDVVIGLMALTLQQ